MTSLTQTRLRELMSHNEARRHFTNEMATEVLAEINRLTTANNLASADLDRRQTEIERLRTEATTLRERVAELEQALMATQLHLMVRPHMRMSGAEENVRALISAALNGGGK